jgi:transcriptional regulator with XRE-family HTH domain
MTVMAGGAERVRQLRRERLVRWSEAAEVLGISPGQLTNWHRRYRVPAVRTFGRGNRLAYASWLDAVLGSARPDSPEGCMAEVTRQWWAERGQEVA